MLDPLSRSAINRAKSALNLVETDDAPVPSVGVAFLDLSRKDLARYSVLRGLDILNRGQGALRKENFEMDCSDAIAKRLGLEYALSSLYVPADVLQRPMASEYARSMATAPGAKGGYLTQSTNASFIDTVRATSVTQSLGIEIISGLKDNVTVPRQTGRVTATWQGTEGTSVTAADQAIGQLSMTPKTCIAITDVSEQLLTQSSQLAESFVLHDLAGAVAEAADSAVLNGTGGAQPLGVINTSGITAGQDSGAATQAKLLAFISTAGAANAIRANPGWVANSAAAALLAARQRFTGTDATLWDGSPISGEICGIHALSSEQLAAANLIFGSWSAVVLGEWGTLQLSMSRAGTRFNQGQVGIRAMWMVDVLVRYPQAFVVSTNLS